MKEPGPEMFFVIFFFLFTVSPFWPALALCSPQTVSEEENGI